MKTSQKILNFLETDELERIIPKDGLQQLISCVDEAKEVWLEAMKLIKNIEGKTDSGIELNEKSKLYALDAIAVLKKIGISRGKRMKAAKIFSLYYLAVHLIDDAIEDKEKIRQKFSKKSNKLSHNEVAPMITSFILNLNLAIISILSEENQKRVNTYLEKVNLSLNRQIKYFLAEKNLKMSSIEVLNVKQHSVSGEATSFIADSLEVVGINPSKKWKELKKALFWMGSLTQYTDDLRDLENDRERGSLNLLIAIEEELKSIKEARKKWLRMYSEEEKIMISCLKSSQINDIEIFRAIPWHPFFMKHLA